jgi:hypothetical protein
MAAAILMVAIGCAGGGKQGATMSEEPASQSTAGGWRTFGAPLRPEASVVKSSDLLGSPERYNGQTLLVEGTIVDVCQNKGCWMTFMEGEKEMRVRFKDYAFFVPKDCGGRKARIEGLFEIREVPAEEARHYLEDAGKLDEAQKITGPVPSYTFMASGVTIEP